MAADGHLNFDTKLDTKEFVKGTEHMGDSLGKLTSQLKSAAKAIGVVFGIKEIVAFGKSALESAAEVKAANSQMLQTFGQLSDAAEDAMGRVADASGIVKTRLQGVGTSIYAFARTSGMETSQALGMMEEALQAAADSAAYYDRSLEDTSATLLSFLKGNYANDAALGLSATETTRNAAANKLYGKSFKELSEAQKQLTLLQMVKDANALSGAEGQAAREAEGWENVLGNLKETWKQLTAVLGQPILMVTTAAVQRLTSALGYLTEKARLAVGTVSEMFGLEADDTSGIADNIAESVALQDDLTASAEETAAAQEKTLAGFDKINTLSSSGTPVAPAGQVTAAVTPVTNATETKKAAEKLGSDLQKYIEPIRLAWDANSPGLISSVRTAAGNIRDLTVSIGESLAEVWTNGSGERFVGNIIVLFTDLIGIIGDISGALDTAWNDGGAGTALVQSYADRWNALLELIHTVSSTFREAWNDGTGVSILSNILGIITDINDIWTGLWTQFKKGWEQNDAGLRICNALLDIADSILGTIGDITDATADWVKEIDFSPLLESIAGLLEEIGPLTDNIGSGLAWFYENVLLPLGKWTLQKAVPTFLDLLSGALKVVNQVLTVFRPLAKFLFDSFLKPIAQWTGGVIISVLSSLAGILSSIGDWISRHQTLCEDLAIVIGSVAAAIGILMGGQAIAGLIAQLPVLIAQTVAQTSALIANAAAWIAANAPIIALTAAIAGVIAIGALLIKHWDDVKAFMIEVWEKIKNAFSVVADWFGKLFTEAWTNIKNAWRSVTKWFSDLWESIKAIFAAVGKWFTDRFTEAWNGIVSIFTGIGKWFSDRWGDIKEVFSAVGKWFGDRFTEAWEAIKLVFSDPAKFFKEVWKAIKSCFSNVTSWFKSKFAAAWQAVKDVFSAGGKIFEGIADSIASVFKEIVNGLIDGINWVIAQPFNAINGILEHIRDISIMKIEPFSWIETFEVPEIPHLAKGTVVPANYGSFLAVLGDNKREAEVVSPISTMKKALAEVLAQNGGSSPKEIVLYTYLYPNSAAFHREVIKVVNNDKSNKGG